MRPPNRPQSARIRSRLDENSTCIADIESVDSGLVGFHALLVKYLIPEVALLLHSSRNEFQVQRSPNSATRFYFANIVCAFDHTDPCVAIDDVTRKAAMSAASTDQSSTVHPDFEPWSNSLMQRSERYTFAAQPRAS
ncbi:hypothetical protein NEOLEDRAFT_1184001 [Neolentinus lepideus HHB14362 ss-1]|uniref:Uncharacterized protein n=1 Tax=Neolentinus lepideus HHB14362 ss-1 TaxID=1314782 RepID=A0A165MU91_9AGAM|nr:hypothetical protein NEOLEDRAFT_1184001 [Neolentinus lepideus HHB14362 ss-1]